MSDQWSSLPYGDRVLTHVSYTHTESRGPLALTVTASISLSAVTTMLVAIAVRGFKTHHQFARSQVGAYFLSLVLSDLLQASGSVMNVRWMAIEGVNIGRFCTVQAALKQTGNVGTALWSLVIAIHTFSLLFLRLRIPNLVFYCIFFGVWFLIAFVVMMGPVLLQTTSRGPFWGISGYWCWITDAYHIEQFTNEYLFMFLTVGVSFILYSLIFFRLRGNIQGYGWNMKFRRVQHAWTESASDDEQMSAVGKQMLWYPVAYAVIIVPIAVCRWLVIFHHKVPYGATMAADSIFMLSGFVNAILYSTTRKIVSIPPILHCTRFVRIRPPRCERGTYGISGGPSLDEMQFAVPISSTEAKFSIQSPDEYNFRTAGYLNDPDQGARYVTPVVVEDFWQRRQAFEFPNYVRRAIAGGKSLPLLSEEHSGSALDFQPSDAGHVVDVRYALSHQREEGRMEPGARKNLLPPPSPPSPLAAAAMKYTAPYNVTRLGGQGESGGINPISVITGNNASDVTESPQPSESASMTGGPPSFHHKRFSGWSFPSLQDATNAGVGAVHDETCGDNNSVHTELEEMRFASPSPERVMRRLPSRTVSADNLSLPRWPPRSYPWE